MRPELRAFLSRRGESLAAAAGCLAGGWIAVQGGWFLALVGGALALLCLGWAVTALRRARFQPAEVSGPGLVELIEGRIGYFGAGAVLGGQVALDDLAEIRLITLRDARYWRLKTLDGQALLIPTATAGAEVLYDAFAALPGIDMGRITVALDSRSVVLSLWSRPGVTLP